MQMRRIVKSAAYLTNDGFKGDFVADLWEQWHSTNGNPFNRDQDYLALAVGRLSEAASVAWEDIGALSPRYATRSFKSAFEDRQLV